MYSKEELKNIAGAFNFLLVALIINIAVGLSCIFIPMIITISEENGVIFFLIFFLLIVISAILSLISLINYSIQRKNPIICTILYCILILLPLISLITLLCISSSTTKLFNKQGIKVGLLGINKADIDNL